MEVRNKLYGYGLIKDDVDELMVRLIEHNFLNEERFARSFAGGKFRVKKWGRNKIVLELKKRQISDFCIRKGLEEIDDDRYLETLRELIEKKTRDYKVKNVFQRNGKIASYCYSKGYESDLIWQELNSGEQ